MKDADVGELWNKAKLPVVRDLIRKLVEERTDKYEQQGFLIQGGRKALESFGIDPEEFKK